MCASSEISYLPDWNKKGIHLTSSVKDVGRFLQCGLVGREMIWDSGDPSSSPYSDSTQDFHGPQCSHL